MTTRTIAATLTDQTTTINVATAGELSQRNLVAHRAASAWHRCQVEITELQRRKRSYRHVLATYCAEWL